MGIRIQNKFGFSLLEVVMVISILGIIVPAMFSMYFASMRAQRKVIVLRDTKRNGDNALSTIESLIKQNAVSIHNAAPPTGSNQVCTNSIPTASCTELFFKDKDGTWFSFVTSNSKIASNSGALLGSTSGYLTNDKSIVSLFDLRCSYISDASPALVSITFTIAQNGPTGRPEDISSLNYQTKVKLRSY